MSTATTTSSDTTIPADIQARVRKQIESGKFADGHAVLSEALDLLESRQSTIQKWREMVAVADEDIANGRIGPFDAEATIAAVEKRLAEHGITD